MFKLSQRDLLRTASFCQLRLRKPREFCPRDKVSLNCFGKNSRPNMAGSNFECWKKRNCLNLQSVKVMPLLWTVEWYTVYIYHILTSSVIITCSHSSLRYFKWSSLHHSLHTSGDAIHGVRCYLRHFRDIKIELPQGNEYQKFLETTSKVFPWGRNRGIRLIFFPNFRYLPFCGKAQNIYKMSKSFHGKTLWHTGSSCLI